MDIAKVTSKGQVTIPKAVRDDLELEPGSKLLFVKSGDSWRVVSAEKTLDSPAFTRDTSDQIKQNLLAEVAEKYDIDSDQVIRNAGEKPVGQLLDEIRQAFKGVADENGWKTEQDVADFIRASRRGESG